MTDFRVKQMSDERLKVLRRHIQSWRLGITETEIPEAIECLLELFNETARLRAECAEKENEIAALTVERDDLFHERKFHD